MRQLTRRTPRVPSPALNRTVYVGNLAYATTEAALTQLFATAGTVRSVKIVRHAETDYPRGFAYVEMVSSDDASRVIERLNAHAFEGRKLDVSAASRQK